MPSTAARLATEAKAICDAADRENRPLTADERVYVQDLIDRAKERGALEKSFREIDPGLGLGMEYSVGGPESAGGPGDRFIASDGWKSVSDPGRRGRNWSSGMVDVGPMALGYKGTLLEGTGSPGSGTGGGAIPIPQVVPGVAETLFQPLTLEMLLNAGQATGNTVRYAIEGTATSGAAGVAEGGDKPQSTLALSTRDEPIKKIATSIIASDELVDDAPALQSFVNQRLSLFVKIESERQLLRGTSGGNEVQGLLTSRNVPIYAGGTAAGNRAIQIFKAMNGVRGSAFVEPEWVVMHPTDYEVIRLLQDNSGQFYGGGPFSGGYGVGSPAAASGQVSGAIDTLWGKPTYVTAAIGAGTALVGSRAAAQVWSKGGVNVEVSNSHSDLFFKDLVAIRAERRLALCLYRPGALVEVRLA